MCDNRIGPLEEELFLAVSEQNYGCVKRMLEAGSRCNFVHRSGVTPLIKAVQVGSEDIVLALATAGGKCDSHGDDVGVESLLGDGKSDDLFAKEGHECERPRWTGRHGAPEGKRMLQFFEDSCSDFSDEEPSRSKRRPNPIGDWSAGVTPPPASSSPPSSALIDLATLSETLPASKQKERKSSGQKPAKSQDEEKNDRGNDGAFYPFRNVLSTMKFGERIFSRQAVKRGYQVGAVGLSPTSEPPLAVPQPPPPAASPVSSPSSAPALSTTNRKRGSGSWGNEASFNSYLSSSPVATSRSSSGKNSPECDIGAVGGPLCLLSDCGEEPLIGASCTSEFTEKCDLNMTDSAKRTPLHHAALRGDARIAAILVDAGCRLNPVDKQGSTPLHLASACGVRGVVRVLLKAKARVNLRNNQKVTALYVAASRGFASICEALLSAGALVDAGDGSDRTPLYIAVTRSHHDVIDVLLRHGAKASASTIHGETPLCEAVNRDDVPTVTRLLQHGAKAPASSPYLLHHTIRSRQHRMFALILESGICRINGREGRNGDPPLMLACSSGQAGLVEALLRNGASTNIANRNGRTPLQEAISGCPSLDSFKAITDSLIQAGVDINLTPLPPLTLALRLRRGDFAEWLVRRGADLRVACRSCDSPRGMLELARQSGRKSLTKILIYSGFDIHNCPLPCERDGPLEMARCAGESVCFGCHSKNDDEEERCWLLERKKNPLRLDELARIAYRKSVADGLALEAIVNKIPFSGTIKRFILLENVADEVQ